MQELLSTEDKIEILLFDSSQGKTLRSIKLIEWRHLLTIGALKANLELPGFNDAPSVGILSLEMEFLPKSGLQLVPERNLNEHLTKEKKFKELDRLRFYDYASQFWKEFTSIADDFAKRNVKIYAESEDK